MGDLTNPVIVLVANELGAKEIPLRAIPHVAVSDRYVRAIHRAGGRALVLPAIEGAPETPAAELLEPADGLLLIGGGEIDPARYGQRQHTMSYGFNQMRDRIELALAQHALAGDMPLLAICRGIQVVNVAAGGTLYQHLADLPGIDPETHGRPHDLVLAEHPVAVEPSSTLERIVGPGTLDHCTSAHHQSIDLLGAGLKVTAYAVDGCVEAIEATDRPGFCLGVQWHPELTAETDSLQQALFDALVAAAGPSAEARAAARHLPAAAERVGASTSV
jgi:putative glutamine amidotransferase